METRRMKAASSGAGQQEQQEQQEQQQLAGALGGGRGAGSPFQQLPSLGAEAVLAHLPDADRKSWRLASKASAALVDAHTARLHLKLAPGTQLGAGALATRFPRVQHLTVTAEGKEAVTDGTLAGLKAAFGAPWRSVSTLELGPLPAASMALVAAACPNATACSLLAPPATTATQKLWHEEERVDAAAIHSISGALPQLAALTVAMPLEGEAMVAIAACSGLTSLKLGRIHSHYASRLPGMQQLAALDVAFQDEGYCGMTECVTGLEQLTALTRLALQSVKQPYSTLSRDVEVLLPAGDGQHLPTSLISLTLKRVMLPNAPYLPNLVTLDYEGGQVDAAVLKALAQGGSLRSISVSKLQLTKECHAVPLPSLTSLAVTGKCSADASSRLALVFPALSSLSLRCDCALASGAALCEGLSVLQRLDLSISPIVHMGDHVAGFGTWKHQGLTTQANDMEVLATLPALTHLTVNAVPAHISGLGAFSHLQHLELVLDGDFMKMDEPLLAALASACLPTQLHSVTFLFELHKAVYMERFDFDDNEFGEFGGGEMFDEVAPHYPTRNKQFGTAVDAALELLLRSSVPHVRWIFDEANIASITPMRLWALAGSPSIKKLEIVGGKGSCVAPALIEQALAKHAGRALAIVRSSKEYPCFRVS